MRKKLSFYLVLAILVLGISACAGRNPEASLPAESIETTEIPETSLLAESTQATENPETTYQTEETETTEPVYQDDTAGTDDTQPPENATTENAATENTAPSQIPYCGFYTNEGLDGGNNGFDAFMAPFEDVTMELFEDGSAVLTIAGSVWDIKWDENYLYNPQSGEEFRYTYGSGYLTFDWAKQYGLLDHYEVYYSQNEEEQHNFFDSTDFSREPYFIFRDAGIQYGFTDDFWEGCSVWCAVQNHRISAKASSTLAPQGKFSYEPANIINSNRSNAWIEGAAGYGIGEYVEITRSYTVTDEAYGLDFTELCVVNGYAQTPEKWGANSRVKDLKLSFNGSYIDTIHLEDSIRPQYFDLTKYHLHAASGADSVFRFTIASAYPGERYMDTAITGIEMRFSTPNH